MVRGMRGRGLGVVAAAALLFLGLEPTAPASCTLTGMTPVR
jgi:hypothetical protein